MKSGIVLSAIFITLITLAGAAYVAHGEQIGSQRWDLRMIEESPIWKYLLVNYAYADKVKYWPERKAALQIVINRFPDSRWADDAALFLAGGQASFEGDMKGAIAALKQVMEKYPSEHTIVSRWEYGRGCGLDEAWLMCRGGLVFLNPDRSIRERRPFDRYGKISQEKREILVYFDHLGKYPRLTKDVAQLMIADMLVTQGDVAGAIAELKAIIARYPNLAAITATDREAANKTDGYLIGHGFHGNSPIWRPQYSAYIRLMNLYQSQGKKAKAIATGLALASSCSPDGWHLNINRTVGDFLATNSRWAEAEKQYQLALKGYRKVVENTISRRESFGDPPPPGSVSWRQQILEEWGMGAKLTKLENLVRDAQANR